MQPNRKPESLTHSWEPQTPKLGIPTDPLETEKFELIRAQAKTQALGPFQTVDLKAPQFGKCQEH